MPQPSQRKAPTYMQRQTLRLLKRAHHPFPLQRASFAHVHATRRGDQPTAGDIAGQQAAVIAVRS